MFVATLLRPTSLQCEEALKSIWEDMLRLGPWDLHHARLPQPKTTALQYHNRHRLASFYSEHMEMGMLRMMVCECQRILSKVNPSEKSAVEKQVQILQMQLRESRVKAKLHLENAAMNQLQVKRVRLR